MPSESNHTQPQVPVVAIDGPSGSGKGTIAQWLAKKLGWHLLDSGALYRVVAVAAKQQGLPLDDVERLAILARNMHVTFETAGDDGVVVMLNESDVSLQLRSEETAKAASVVAAMLQVRKALLERQRAFRQPPGLVADGRDMGTVVFKDADLKVFLTASSEERAKRRYNQLIKKGISANLAGLLRDIKDRDARDVSRKTAPLKPAEEATIIDTTELSINEVCDTVFDWVQRNGLV